eukprot:m.119765 g.119765  ORF g.119765 m.119765 type:complete len:545 (+) comp13314_c0_seq1:1-1635(+)
MNFHFAIASEEIVEACLPGGILYPPTKAAANPLGATIGGVLGPIIFFYVFSALFDSGGAFEEAGYSFGDVQPGWAIPTATDIPLAWAVALLAFGPGHPAISYMLLLAVVDDAMGVVIVAIFYPDPEHPTKPVWLLLVLLSMAVAYAMRRLRFMDWRPYIFGAGPLAWYGMLRSGLHPALALVFVVPFMPSSLRVVSGLKPDPEAGGAEVDEGGSLKSDEGSLGSGEHPPPQGPGGHHDDPHSRHRERMKIPLFNLEHSVKFFVDFFVLFLFGLANAGVDVTEVGPMTAVIYLAATIGKTFGIAFMGWLMTRLGYPPPDGISQRSLVLIGFIASIGLTVALFVSGAAYEQDIPVEAKIQSQAKLGVLFALLNCPIALAIAKVVSFEIVSSEPGTTEGPEDKAVAMGAVVDADRLPPTARPDEEEDDEFVEHVVAIQFVDRLNWIHASVKDVEEQTNMTRKHFVKSMKERLHEMEQESHREDELTLARQRTLSAGRPELHTARHAALQAFRQSQAIRNPLTLELDEGESDPEDNADTTANGVEAAV